MSNQLPPERDAASTVDAADMVNTLHEGTWAAVLGLVLQSATRDEVRGTVQIRPDHRQPHGLVHGGVYSAIIESVASIGASIDAWPAGNHVVGLENHTSFVRAAREGTLHARGTPVTRGRRSQLWDVVLTNDAQAIVATGRVRLLVLPPDAEVAGAGLARKE